MIRSTWQVRASWLSLALAAAGCKAVDSPTSSVVAQMGPAAAAEAPWLESATLTLVQSPAGASSSSLATAPVDGVVQASHESEINVQTNPAAGEGGVVRVLAVRYPHPDGRRDYARAELVLADANPPAPAADTWRTKLGRFIDSTTPGVEWGAGIHEAKGLDISIVELQLMLATAEKAASSGKAKKLPDGVDATVEVNGKDISPSPSAALKLRILAMRVEREGKLISYPGSAADLKAAVKAPGGAAVDTAMPIAAAGQPAGAAATPPALAASSP